MTRWWLLAAVAFVVVGCGGATETGERYRAERDLWRMNRAWERLSIRPDLVTDDERRAVAERYEELAARYGTAVPAAEDSDGRTEAFQMHTISGQALLNAGRIYLITGENARADSLLRRLEEDFTDVGPLAADAALTRARLAEGESRWADAADAYQTVVELVPPAAAGGTGAPGMVLQLPLRVARLRAGAAGDTTAATRPPHYENARVYYRSVVESFPGTAVAVECRSRLVDVDSDLGRWDRAVEQLMILDIEARTLEPPIQDVGEVRFALAEAQRRLGRDADAQATLRALADEDVRSAYAPRALISLAGFAERAGRADEAIAYLDRVAEEHSDEEDLSASAKLQKARILEARGDWKEALEILRALPVQHPLAEAALMAPLEIAGHYDRVGDAEGRGQALAEAARTYQEVLRRYPAESITVSARAKLADVYLIERRFPEAVETLILLAEELRGRPAGMTALARAADLAYGQMADTLRAVQLLEQGAVWYQGTEFGDQAKKQADTLREDMGR